MRGRRIVMGAAVLAALALALVAGLSARADGEARDRTATPCHAQVNCVGQAANVPLGSSALPSVAVVAVAALALVARFELTPAAWHDRLVAGRLFRPPRFLG